MKRTAKKAAALLLSGAMAVTAIPALPASAVWIDAGIPDFVPKSYEDTIKFLNEFGKTHTVSDYICIIREIRPNEGWSYTTNAESMLISDQTYSIKMDKPSEDNPDYKNQLRLYENYQKVLEELGEAGVNKLPQYQVLVFQPDKNMQYNIELSASRFRYVEPSGGSDELVVDPVEVVELQKNEYVFEKTDSGITETDIYGWMPDSIDEFAAFRKANGEISLHGNYVVICSDVNYSTGAELFLGQTGAKYVKERTETIEYMRMVPSMMLAGESSRSVSLYSPKEEGVAVFTQYVGRTFDDSPAEIANATVVSKLIDRKWLLSIHDGAAYDINADGRFNADDVRLVSNYLTTLGTLTDAQLIAADANGDKCVDARDLTLLKQLLISDIKKETTGAATTRSAAMWADAPSEATEGGGGWGGYGGGDGSPITGKSWGAPEGSEESYYSNAQAQANILTAGEWNDNDNWEFFTELLKKGTVEFPSYGLDPAHRVKLTVTSADGKAVPNLTVSMTGGTSDWTAKTDRSGVAYLFYNSADAGKKLTISAGTKALTSFTVPEDTVIEITQPDPQQGTTVSGVTEPTLTTTTLPGVFGYSDGWYDEEDWYTPQTTQPAKGLYVPEVVLEASYDGAGADYTDTEVMFILDTTGSMGDEIAFLKKDFAAIAKDVDNGKMKFSVNFYRDEGDDYVTRCNPFTDDVDKICTLIKAENADGGGDTPEAVDQILQETLLQGQWSEKTNKIAFLIFDAPPHKGDKISANIVEAVKAAAAKGIRVVPVVASNASRNTELFGRALSIITNANYVFLTDDSGVGGSHLEPIIGDYDVELLHDIIVRNILQAAGEPVPEKKIIERTTEPPVTKTGVPEDVTTTTTTVVTRPVG